MTIGIDAQGADEVARGGTGRPDEAAAFLAANPDVEAVQLVLTDANGVGRGKNIAREELAALYAQGRNVAGSILGLDITGEDVEDTGLVWAVGDADQCCRPVAGTLTRAPWLRSSYGAGARHHVRTRRSRRAGADPRHVLASVVRRCDGARATGRSSQSNSSSTCSSAARMATLRPSAGLLTGAHGTAHRCLRTRASRRHVAAVRRPLCRGAGAGPAGAHADVRVRARPVRDHARTSAPTRCARSTKRSSSSAPCAASRPATAASPSFMAKPFADRAGSGMHLHASLAGRDGRTPFAAHDPAGTPALRHAIGGLRGDAGRRHGGVCAACQFLPAFPHA